MKGKMLIWCCLSISAVAAQTSSQIGWSLSPLGNPSYNNIYSFFAEADSLCHNSIVYANALWRDSIGSSGQPPQIQSLVSMNQSTYGYTPMLDFAWASYPQLYLDNPSNPTNNWTNVQTRAAYLQMLGNYASQYAPPYMFVGNEVNFYLTQDSSDYSNYATFLHDAYDTIKAHSPTTLVGTIVNYEHLSGNAPLNNWTIPHWNVLSDLDTSHLDILGVTTYPFLKYYSANAIPTAYFDPLFAHWGNKAIAITETGWPADSLLTTTWDCSQQEQVDYINRLFTLLSGHNVKAVNWLFLHYLLTHNSAPLQIYCSLSMYDSLGTPYQQTLNAWLPHCATLSSSEDRSNKIKVIVAPNPFSDETHIIFSLQNLDPVTISVKDIFGREIKHVEDIRGPTFVLSRGDLPPGVYFFSVIQNNCILNTGKFVIQ